MYDIHVIENEMKGKIVEVGRRRRWTQERDRVLQIYLVKIYFDINLASDI